MSKMSSDDTRPLTAEQHMAAGAAFLAQAHAAPERKARKLCWLAAGHFDAARTLSAMTAAEVARQTRVDIKSQMAAAQEAMSRRPEGDSPFGPLT